VHSVVPRRQVASGSKCSVARGEPTDILQLATTAQLGVWELNCLACARAFLVLSGEPLFFIVLDG
jgi:hypothetical protein